MGAVSVLGPGLPARIGWSVVALLLVAVAVGQQRANAAARQRVDTLLQSTGLTDRAPTTADTIRREPDPYWAAISVSRALTGEALDPLAFSSLPPRQALQEAALVGARLDLARDLARQAAARRPAVWQAPMLEGTAVYLGWSRRGAPELFTRREEWRTPFERSLALAPGKAEPRRVLAAATLEIWSVLTPGERRAARPTLESAFADPPTFDRLAPAWLSNAESLEEAFELVPATVAAWLTVERLFARQRLWESTVAARVQRREVLETHLEAEVSQLRDRLEGGDLTGARRQLLSITEGTPPDQRYAPAVAHAWQIAPAMAINPTRQAAVRSWLSWAARGKVRGKELLPPGVVDRLATAAGDLDPPERALALLAADRLAEAEALARRAEDLNTERWSDFCVAAARVLADRGEVEEARRLLSQLPEVRRVQLPAAAAMPQDLPGGQGLRVLKAAEWPATAWRWSGPRATLDLLPEAPGELDLVFDVAPPQGAVVEVSLDFEVVWIGVVRPGDEVRLSSAHRTDEPLSLVVESVAGGRVMPGEVRLHMPSARAPAI